MRKRAGVNRSIVVSLSFVLTLISGASSASLFENLIEAAEGALATYGRGSAGGERTDLNTGEIEGALRLALSYSSASAAAKLAGADTFEELLQAVLPARWNHAREVAERFGYTRDFRRLEEQLGQAVQQVLPEIDREIQLALQRVQFGRPREILLSDYQDAGTRYFWQSVSSMLVTRLRPLVEKNLRSTGALSTSEQIIARLKELPVNRLRTDLAEHVLTQSLSGFYRTMARAEARLRSDPQRHPNSLVRRVFG